MPVFSLLRVSFFISFLLHFFLQQNVECLFFFIHELFWPSKRRMPLSVWRLPLDRNVPYRWHVSKPCCFICDQFIGSSSDHPVERSDPHSCGNKTPTANILVACLAGTHLLSGLVGQPITIAMELKRTFGDGPFCSIEKTYTVAKLGGGLASLGTLVPISIDRYISIKHPLSAQCSDRHCEVECLV